MKWSILCLAVPAIPVNCWSRLFHPEVLWFPQSKYNAKVCLPKPIFSGPNIQFLTLAELIAKAWNFPRKAKVIRVKIELPSVS